MRRWLMALLGALLLLLLPAQALAADPIVRVVYPIPSPTDGTLVFQKIPWQPGEKIQGSIEVAISQPVRNLVVQPAGGALTLDETSRRVIPRHRIQFFRSDVPQGATANAETGAPLDPANTYMFDFSADSIPGEDTYRASMEAIGEYLNPESGEWIPFREALPALKLKAYAEAKVELPNQQLTEQWTNLSAPFGLLSFLERFLDLGNYEFFYHENPQAIVSITMPGNPYVRSSVQHTLTVTLDPVTDEDGVSTPWVHFWRVGEKTRTQGIDAPLTQQLTGIVPGETVQIGIFREHEEVDGRIKSVRIPPGIYRSNLTIQTDWGSEFVYPVEIRVRDHSFWSILALILGVALSLMANYWQNRQPFYQAQLKAKQLQKAYFENGMELELIDRVIQRLNSLLAAGDVAAVNQVTGLLEDLVERLPETMVAESLLRELERQKKGVVNWTQVWALVLEAKGLDEVLAALKGYCTANAELQEFGPRFETLQWDGRLKPLPPLGRAGLGTRLKQRAGHWYDAFLGGTPGTVRVKSPEIWDRLTVLVLFVMVNGGLIALQISESYGPNQTFGHSSDYLNLLFWGFAGDATRNKLTALAGNFKSMAELREAVNARTGKGTGAPQPAVNPAPVLPMGQTKPVAEAAPGELPPETKGESA